MDRSGALKLIDFRGRPPTPEFNSYFIPESTVAVNFKVGAKYVSPAYFANSVDLFLEEMDAANIVKTVALGRNAKALNPKQNGFIPNDHIHDLMTAHPDRIIGCAGIDLANTVHNAIEETERCAGLGFRAIHIEPARSFDAMPNDARIFPLYERCIELDMPVVIMTGPLAGPTIEYTNPVYIDDVARRFPKLKIVAGHGCWPWVTQILGVAFKHRNLFLCPDVYMFMPGADEYVRAANTYLQDQFLFGTAYPYRPLQQTAEEFLALPINPVAMEKIVYRNIAKLLKLD
jgi:predicted TIM-barrel fold metal-dependent hydrolase